MEEEKEILKANRDLNVNIERDNINQSEHFFSIELFLIRFMIFIAFIIFSFFSFKLILMENIFQRNIYKSHQLINISNIHMIQELNISLNIEHSRYVHLQIKDRNNKRWEVPKEILNQNFFNKKSNENKNPLFKIEINSLNGNYYNSSKNFSFILYFEENTKNINKSEEKDKKIFYIFNASENFLFSDNYINFESHLTSDDIYGFGERIHNFKLNDGLYTIWPVDQKNYYDDGKGGKNIYGHQPIALHKTKYKNIWLGFIFLNSNAQDVQIYKKGKETILSHKSIGGIIDYYIIVDNSPENVLRDIHYLIGKPILPPYWALGNHQCRWGFKNFSQFKNVYETYKKKEISIDGMWTDIDSMNKYQIFTLDKKKFKELPDYVDNVIHKDYGYFIPIIDIGISYNQSTFNKYSKIGDKFNLFIKSGYSGKNLMAKVWPGKTVFPDFFNPQIDKLWDKGLDDYYDIIKYDGFWLDMNEIANLNRKGKCPGEIFFDLEEENKYEILIKKNLEFSYLPGYIDNINALTTGTISLNGIVYNNIILYNIKPLISVYQCRQTYNYLKKKNKRPFILTRSNSFGIGKFSFHWLGDNFSQNKYIEYSIAGIFNYNIFGIPFTGADICGFNDNSNGKLCARWYNIGAFYPFMRNHNSKRYIDQYPWSFGDDYESIIKKDINYRYSLLRYFYSQLFLISLNEKGSFFKPVMFEFPEDKYSYEDIESKVMIGEAILICAFFENEENDKVFILPNSNFNLYPSGENIINYSSEDNNDKRKKTLSGKLSQLHIFLRGGYIIPMQNTFNKFILNTYYLRQEKINIIINPDHQGMARGVIFYDNDENDILKYNKYIRINLELKNKEIIIKTNNYNLTYSYKDNYINKIEIWRINEILDINGNENNKYINLKIDLIKKESQAIKAMIDNINNKLIINFSDDKNSFLKNLSLLNLKRIYFN